MKNGELRQFFLSAHAGAPDVAGKIFLIVRVGQTTADFLMRGILYKGWDIRYLSSNSKVIDENR